MNNLKQNKMKNIHILPTDKPSRLVRNSNENTLKLCIQTLPLDKKIYCYPQHIYITNDEEIKGGDWFWKPDYNMIFKAKYTPHIGCKKVILTTDQDLDGVQAIDDEFLEWFVKNPSCKYIEVNKEYVTPLGDVVETCYDNERLNYKIIIPKQETLEEAANNYINSDKTPNDYELFIAGAQWQAERMYSEQDMAESFIACWKENVPKGIECKLSFKEWFNDIKKL